MLTILCGLFGIAGAAEPTVGCNGWTNQPGVMEGVVTTRPVDTTVPKPPLGYVEYLPKGYDPNNANALWPLIVFISGVGEIGDGTDTDANGHQLYYNMIRNGPFNLITRQNWDFPAVVVAVQQPGLWNNAGILGNVFTYMQGRYHLDPNRLYLTGLCDGGSGVVHFAAQHPGLLAGILPIEEGNLPNGSEANGLKGLAMWTVHCFNDPIIARTSTIAWVDQSAQVDYGQSNVMANYPGYAGKSYHEAVTVAANGLPASANGPTYTFTECTLTTGSTWVAFAPGTSLGSATFNSWGGTDAQPYAQVTVGTGPGATSAGVVEIGKPTGVYLTDPYSGASATGATVTITIPNGYNATAICNPANGAWTWQSGQEWDYDLTQRSLFTMCWYADHTQGWIDTYGNGTCWDWLLSQQRVVAPAIAVQPQPSSVPAGQSATVAVTATGSGPLLYQWQCNGAAIPSATAASYVITGVTPADNGEAFSVVVANAAGSATSAAATLTVTAASGGEPYLAINHWSNQPGRVEGAITTRPIDTTTPRPPYGYVEYLPLGYNPADHSTVWPLIVFLGNTSESGDGTDTTANSHQLTTQMEKYGPLQQVLAQNWDFPAIIFAAQVTTNWAKAANVQAIITYAQANYRVDATRIFITGAGEGANGALRYAAAYPGIPAGLLTIEAGTPTSAAAATAMAAVPVWAVHAFPDPNTSRTMTIGWMDALAAAANGGTSDCMGTYPGYGGDRNHFAVDSDPQTHLPLNSAGESIVISGATVTNGSTTVGFSSGPTFTSNIFGMWGGSAALPFAQVLMGNGAAPQVSARGYPTSLTLTSGYTGASANTSLSIQTPVGYTTTGYRSDAGAWLWDRNQVWDQSQSDSLALTLMWSQNPVTAWNATWANVMCWDWLLARLRAPTGNA